MCRPPGIAPRARASSLRWCSQPAVEASPRRVCAGVRAGGVLAADFGVVHVEPARHHHLGAVHVAEVGGADVVTSRARIRVVASYVGACVWGGLVAGLASAMMLDGWTWEQMTLKPEVVVANLAKHLQEDLVVHPDQLENADALGHGGATQLVAAVAGGLVASRAKAT